MPICSAYILYACCLFVSFLLDKVNWNYRDKAYFFPMYAEILYLCMKCAIIEALNNILFSYYCFSNTRLAINAFLMREENKQIENSFSVKYIKQKYISFEFILFNRNLYKWNSPNYWLDKIQMLFIICLKFILLTVVVVLHLRRDVIFDVFGVWMFFWLLVWQWLLLVDFPIRPIVCRLKCPCTNPR